MDNPSLREMKREIFRALIELMKNCISLEVNEIFSEDTFLEID